MCSVDASILTGSRQDAITYAKSFLLGGGGLLLASVGVTAAFTGILGLVLLIYFLVSGKRIVDGTLWLIPPEHRPEVAAMTEKVTPLLRRYLVGLLVIVTYTAIVGWIGFGPIFHLPHRPAARPHRRRPRAHSGCGPFSSAVLVGLTAIQQADLMGGAGDRRGLRWC